MGVAFSPPLCAEEAPSSYDPYVLVEEFTAATLAPGEIKIGTDLEAGLAPDLMLGTDLVAAVVGATTLSLKYRVVQTEKHEVAFGLRGAYLNKKAILWGSVEEHFDDLDARIVRPSLAWSNKLSPRLKIHTFWAKGFGKIRAKLSEKGRRKLWEAKHPGEDYDKRGQVLPDEPEDDADDTTANQEKPTTKQSSLTQQSTQVQSIAGLAQDRFQLTGEFTRLNGNKILVTSRIEQTVLERLKSDLFKLTVAHQWIWSSFQMRLGIGLQYVVISGHDLDDAQIDATGTLPASDIGFYWRF